VISDETWTQDIHQGWRAWTVTPRCIGGRGRCVYRHLSAHVDKEGAFTDSPMHTWTRKVHLQTFWCSQRRGWCIYRHLVNMGAFENKFCKASSSSNSSLFLWKPILPSFSRRGQPPASWLLVPNQPWSAIFDNHILSAKHPTSPLSGILVPKRVFQFL
jgi:hypothetical protein